MASQSLEAGDTTFVQSRITPEVEALLKPPAKPTPLSLDYYCAKCGTRITQWTAEIVGDAQKLRLTAHCHGETEIRMVHLDMAGFMFRSEND